MQNNNQRLYEDMILIDDEYIKTQSVSETHFV